MKKSTIKKSTKKNRQARFFRSTPAIDAALERYLENERTRGRFIDLSDAIREALVASPILFPIATLEGNGKAAQ